MSNQTYADWSVWATPYNELQKINQAASEKVIRECISFYTDSTTTIVKSMQTLPKFSSPEDFVGTQMKLLTKQGEKNLEFMQNIFQIYQDAIKENTQWTESKVNTALKTVDKVKKSYEDAA
jgi:hypothetical protein